MLATVLRLKVLHEEADRLARGERDYLAKGTWTKFLFKIKIALLSFIRGTLVHTIQMICFVE